MFGSLQNFGKLGASGGTSNLIAQLFAGGTEGFASGLSVTEAYQKGWLFQDSAGTTPAAIESPVGLALDSSQGLVLGPELVTNGDFSSGSTGWTLGTGWSVSGGAASSAGGNQFASISQTILATAGKRYLVSFDVSCTSGSLLIRLGGGTNLLNINATGKVTARLVAEGAGIAFLSNATGFEFVGSIDNISVKELPGNHATQSTSTKRFVLKDSGVYKYLLADGADDHLLCAAEGGGTTGFFLIAGIKLGAVGAAQTIFSDTGTNTGYRVRINASNKLELAAGNGSAYTTVETAATLALNDSAVITAWHDGTNLNVQINGGTVAQAAFATASAGTTGFTLFQDNGASTSYFKGNVAAILYTKNSAPNASLRAALQASINASMGGVY